MMSEDENNTVGQSPKSPLSMGKEWGSGLGSGRTKLFKHPDDFDILCDRAKGITYIFHQCDLDCTIDHMEYDKDTQRITVFTTDGQKMDLGTRIQWMIRPYIAREQHIIVMRTKDGRAIEGEEVHLKMKKPEDEENQEDSADNTGGLADLIDPIK